MEIRIIRALKMQRRISKGDDMLRLPETVFVVVQETEYARRMSGVNGIHLFTDASHERNRVNS